MAAAVLARYARLLHRYPLGTKVVTSGLLLGSGDLATQATFENQIRARRVLKFTALGALVVAPTLHVWYAFLAIKFPGNVLARVALDQFCFAPIFLTGFIFLNSMLDDGDANRAWNMLQRDIGSTLATNWILWVPYQFLNFKYVPVEFQVLANNACSLFWNSYLSYSLHKTTMTNHEEE